MARQNTQEASAAAAQAERERRRRIQAVIDYKQVNVDKCRDLINSFQGLKGETDSLSKEMIAKSSQCYAPIPEDFGGVSAISVDKGIRTAQNAIALQATDLSDVCAAIGEQIGLLDSYIEELETEIEELRSSL